MHEKLHPWSADELRMKMNEKLDMRTFRMDRIQKLVKSYKTFSRLGMIIDGLNGNPFIVQSDISGYGFSLTIDRTFQMAAGIIALDMMRSLRDIDEMDKAKLILNNLKPQGVNYSIMQQ